MTVLFSGIFWLSLLFCLGTYVFYPVVIWIVGVLRPLHVNKAAVTPFVSVIIPAFNEAKHIQKKIENTLNVDYPKECMEILVGSDGSTDDTALIMQEYVSETVRFFDFTENRGKTAVQNDLVKYARGDILIFTDAASFEDSASFKAIVNNFNDKRVGCVAGCMHFLDTETNLTTQSQGLYWKYESKIREFESRIGSLIGVDGPLYAVKPEYYVPLEYHMISDLLTPLLVLEKGGKVVFESAAQVYEEPTVKTVQEYTTRRRITLRGLVGLRNHGYLLHPLKHPFLSFQILFHKVVRWGVGLLWGLNILSCVVLASQPVFLFLLGLHCLVIALALLGWGASTKGSGYRILTVPYYFSLVNLAATMGIVDFFRKKQAVAWKPVRE